MSNSIDFNNKVFKAIHNTSNGKVNAETVFVYQQKGDLVTADFEGGAIIYGKIIALLTDNQLNMVYQMLTSEGYLKSGKAIAQISFTSEGKMRLDLDWEWLVSGDDKGKSAYLESNR